MNDVGLDTAPMSASTVVLRTASATDRPVLDDLAGLDSAPKLSGAVLLAELDGVPVAALERSSGRVVADPFVSTTGVRALLRARARH